MVEILTKHKPIVVLNGDRFAIRNFADKINATQHAEAVTTSQITRRTPEIVSPATFHNLIKAYNFTQDGNVHIVLTVELANLNFGMSNPMLSAFAESNMLVGAISSDARARVAGEATMLIGYLMEGAMQSQGFASVNKIEFLPLSSIANGVRDVFTCVSNDLGGNVDLFIKLNQIWGIVNESISDFLAGADLMLYRRILSKLHEASIEIDEAPFYPLFEWLKLQTMFLKESLLLDFPKTLQFNEIATLDDLCRYPKFDEGISAFSIRLPVKYAIDGEPLEAIATWVGDWVGSTLAERN